MRYKLGYIVSCVVAAIAVIFLLVAFFNATAVERTDLDEQMAAIYCAIGFSLLIVAAQFVIFGHLLTEIRGLRQDIKGRRK